jgi:putative sigma-54 modulation protein
MHAYVKKSNENPSSLLIVSPKNAIVMNVKIQTVRFDADEKLVEYINQKLQKLKIFHDRIVEIDVFLKLDNVIHTIKDKIAEIRVHVPRHYFFAKTTSKSFEESFDEAFDSLLIQLKKKKEKQAA